MNKDIKKPWRQWCWTFHHYTEEDVTHIKSLGAESYKYIIFGKELTKEGIPHLQGYIDCQKSMRLTGMKKLLDPARGKASCVHLEPANGDRESQRKYCSKGTQPKEEYEKLGANGPNYGLDADVYEMEFVKQREGQGARTDWSEVYDRIKAEPEFSVILQEFPDLAIKYPNGIQKAIDTVLQERNKEKLSYEMNSLRLYCWELALCKELQEKPDKRKIIWYVDQIGGTGKSTFAKYLLSRGDCAYFTNAKTADIAHAYKGERTVIFDFTRSIEGRVNYEVIESIKNGVVFSAKYNSGLKVNATPHIICFSNFQPEKSKLSEDRWDLRDLSPADREYPISSPETIENEELKTHILCDNIADDEEPVVRTTANLEADVPSPKSRGNTGEQVPSLDSAKSCIRITYTDETSCVYTTYVPEGTNPARIPTAATTSGCANAAEDNSIELLGFTSSAPLDI